MTTMNTAKAVENALAGDYGLWVELNSGEFDLYASDLRHCWKNLAPGEPFKVLGVVLNNEERKRA